MTSGTIHKALLRNLLIGAILIAVLAGSLVTLIELRRIDRYVTNISLIEFERISQYYIEFYMNRTEASLTALKQVTKASLDHDLFVSVEFLDDKLEKVVDISIDSFDRIYSRLNSRFGNFTMTGRIKHKTTYFKGQLFVKVMVPVFNNRKGETIGHFQGIYRLSDDKLANLKNQSFYSIILTIFAVFATTIFIYPIIFSLHKKLVSQSYELLRSNTNLLKSFGSAIAERDSDTNSHNFRVTLYSVRLAEKIGLDRPQIRALIKGAFLHDIGKIGISDTILLKPGKLTEQEFETMKQHVVIGAKIINHNDWLKDAVDVVQYHHEKFDGSGYLSGLKNKEIPANAKIFAISDVFDSLTSRRPYKEPFPIEKSMQIIRENSGKHFDPEFVNAFEHIAEDLYRQIFGLENEDQLNSHLNLIVGKYFTAEI